MPNIVVMPSKGAIGDLKALSNYITPSARLFFICSCTMSYMSVSIGAKVKCVGTKA